MSASAGLTDDGGKSQPRITPGNGTRSRRRRQDEQDVWKQLAGDEFRGLDSAKVWYLLTLCVSEALGTAILVGLGCGSILTGKPFVDGQDTHLNIVLSFTFTISLCVTVFGHVSGCHINPAVSLAAVLFGQMSLPKFFMYVVSQCVGAIVGIAALWLISPDYCTAGGLCVTQPNVHVQPYQALVAEALMTGVLVLCVGAAWDRRNHDKHDSMPVKFGLAVGALVIPGAKYSGASLNPARSFGPALMSGVWTNHWIYWLGPLSGSVVAVAIYRTFLAEVSPPKPVLTRVPDHDEEHPL